MSRDPLPPEAATDWRLRGRAFLPKDVEAVRGWTPAVILVEPQMAENMGTAARAMGNCGLGDLRLVRPREVPMDERAVRASSGAEAILEQARVFDTLEEAVADLVHVYATTARRRDMMKRVVTPHLAAAEMRGYLTHATTPEPCGLLFGRERSGLENDHIALAEAIIEVPLNPSFCSLNLAQAVLLVGYEWYSAADATPVEQPAERNSPPATQEELLSFYLHLEAELDRVGFLRVPDKRPGMVRNIRSIFARAGLTRQEVNTLHGIVRDLAWGGKEGRSRSNGWRRAALETQARMDAEAEAGEGGDD